MAVDVKKGDGWVGRSIRRLEDPALVAGNGRFTGDLPAARWVRFVRSSVAAGRIRRLPPPLAVTYWTPLVESASSGPVNVTIGWLLSTYTFLV